MARLSTRSAARAIAVAAALAAAPAAADGPVADEPVADGPGACPDTPHRFETFSLFAPALGAPKRVLVYLPPGYDCDLGRHYPVFYFNDGHDLFDWNPFADDLDPLLAAEIEGREAWYGSWRLAGQLNRAAAAGRLPPMIVVGIASDDGPRSRDLAPVAWGGAMEGRGIGYGDFIARIVVPAVDGRYRTAADRRCRGIGGSSLGGVSALQIGLTHADDFAMVLALSPVVGDRAIATYLAAAWPAIHRIEPTAFLVDFDDDAIGRADHDWFAAMAGTAVHAGQATLLRTPGGRHNIASWRERAVPALERLFAEHCPDLVLMVAALRADRG